MTEEVPSSRYFLGRIPWYSVLIVAGIVIAILLGSIEGKRKGLPRDIALDIAIVGIPTGIIGARLYYVALSWDQYAANPISILKIWEGGIAIYGCILGAALGVFALARCKKLAYGDLLDITAPGLILAQAIGRWGNFFNQEAYGALVTDPGMQFFPCSVLIGTEWHLATFFYESLWDFLVFLILWFVLRKRVFRSGGLIAWELLLYGCGRFVVEQLRTDSLWLGSLRASQWLGALMCVGAGAFLLFFPAEKRAIRLTAGLCLAAHWFSGSWLAGTIAAEIAGLVLACLYLRGKRKWRLLPAGLLAAAGLLLAGSGQFSPADSLLCGIAYSAAVAALYFPDCARKEVPECPLVERRT